MWKKSTPSTKKAIGVKKKNYWLLLPVLAGFAPLVALGIIFLHLQGKFFIYQEKLPQDPNTNKVDYHSVIRVLEGFQLHTFEFARYYGDAPFRATFAPHTPMEVELTVNEKSSHKKLLVIRGQDFISNQVLELLTYSEGKFSIIHNFSEVRGEQIAFDSTNVSLENLDEDSEPEVMESYFLNYNTGPVWRKDRFDYDANKKMYVKTKTWDEAAH